MIGYFDALCEAMGELGKDPRTIFMGQAVAYEGTAMSKTFRDVPREKLFELPVFEDCQLGMAIGASLNGEIPICCYPRINFLLLAMSQLVLHLDKMAAYSRGEHKPVVIVRTSIGSDHPMNPGEQHLGEYTGAIANMLDHVHVRELFKPEDIRPAYLAALSRSGPSLLVEHMEYY
jgi:pyruvate/2-oxoglutarate/acetoin dehydrogenase E1 component